MASRGSCVRAAEVCGEPSSFFLKKYFLIFLITVDTLISFKLAIRRFHNLQSDPPHRSSTDLALHTVITMLFTTFLMQCFTLL